MPSVANTTGMLVNLVVLLAFTRWANMDVPMKDVQCCFLYPCASSALPFHKLINALSVVCGHFRPVASPAVSPQLRVSLITSRTSEKRSNAQTRERFTQRFSWHAYRLPVSTKISYLQYTILKSGFSKDCSVCRNYFVYSAADLRTQNASEYEPMN